jgi:hypothetical protein
VEIGDVSKYTHITSQVIGNLKIELPIHKSTNIVEKTRYARELQYERIPSRKEYFN